MAEPASFEVDCHNERHSITISVGNKTLTTQLRGLLPSSSYSCCVSAVYQEYTSKAICTHITTLGNAERSVASNSSDSGSAESKDLVSNSVNVVGGVLGFIIVVLLILLVISGIALVFLLQPELKRRMTHGG